MSATMSREQATDLAERIRRDMGLGDPIVEMEEEGMIDPSGPTRVVVRRVHLERDGDGPYQVCLEQGSARQCFADVADYLARLPPPEAPLFPSAEGLIMPGPSLSNSPDIGEGPDERA